MTNAGKFVTNGLVRQFILAVFASIALFEFYVIVIALVDNTNILTTNGLTKSIWINRWSQWQRDSVDVSALLYYPVYGVLVHAIPDALAQLGSARTDYLIPRKMALLNAMFSTFATLALYWALRQLTVRRLSAVFGCLLHIVSAYLFIDSIQSEDVMPGYFFAVLSFAFFVAYLHSGNYASLFGWAIAVSFSSFLQWIVFVPVAMGYASAFVLLACRSRDILMMKFRTRDILDFIILPLFAVVTGCVAFYLIFRAISPHAITFFDYVMPSKAGSGWSGWSLHKLSTLFIHIFEYNSMSLYGNFTGTEKIVSNILSAATSAFTFIFVLYTLVSGYAERRRASIMLFLVVSLFVGLAMALYSQPHDSQLWLSPMLFAPVGMALLVDKALAQRSKTIAIIVVGAIALSTGFMARQNFDAVWQRKGRDGKSIIAAQEFIRRFPQDTTFVIWKPSDGAQSYLAIYEYLGNIQHWKAGNIQINNEFTLRKGISGKDAATRVAKSIDIAFKEGRRVVANTLWTDTPDRFSAIHARFVDRETSAEFYKILQARYRATKLFETKFGEFVELTPIETQ